MNTLTFHASQMMRDAAQAGVIDTVWEAVWGDALTPPSVFAWVLEQRDLERFQNPHRFELLEHPYSQRYQESIFPSAVHTAPADYWAVELARVVVPKGCVGFLTGIDQVLNDVDGSYYPSNVHYWGSPTFVFGEVDDCRWYLRLDSFDGFQPPRWALSSTVPIPTDLLPGWPYTELYEIPALWYPAGNSAGLKLIVPGRHMLRFYFVTPPQTLYQWQVTGRLRAYIQSTFNPEAAANARLF